MLTVAWDWLAGFDSVACKIKRLKPTNAKMRTKRHVALSRALTSLYKKIPLRLVLTMPSDGPRRHHGMVTLFWNLSGRMTVDLGRFPADSMIWGWTCGAPIKSRSMESDGLWTGRVRGVRLISTLWPLKCLWFPHAGIVTPAREPVPGLRGILEKFVVPRALHKHTNPAISGSRALGASLHDLTGVFQPCGFVSGAFSDFG